jgi:hypothetical protein
MPSMSFDKAESSPRQALFQELDANSSPGQVGDHLPQVAQIASEPVEAMNDDMIAFPDEGQ